MPTYNELVFVARRADLDEEGASRLRRFLQATARGHELLKRRPGGGRRRAARRPTRASTAGSRTAAVKATLPVFFPEDERRGRSASRTRREWAAYERGCATNELLKRPAGRAGAADQRVPARRGAGPGDIAGWNEPARGRVHQVHAGEPLPLAVALEEAAHLGLVGARPRVAGHQPPDDLQEAEVAGRDDVHPALAVQGEHLDRPRADLADRAAGAGTSCSCRSTRPRGDLLGAAAHGDRALGREVERDELRRRLAGDRGGRRRVAHAGGRAAVAEGARSAAAGSPSPARARSAAR